MKSQTRSISPIWRWESISFSRRSKLPDRPGVYAICVLNQIYYIGKAKSLKQRWRGTQHHRYHVAMLVPFSYLRYTTVRQSDLSGCENHLIHEIDPPWNYTPDPIDGWIGALFWHLRGHNHSDSPPLDWVKLGLYFAIGITTVFVIDAHVATPIVESLWSWAARLIQRMTHLAR